MDSSTVTNLIEKMSHACRESQTLYSIGFSLYLCWGWASQTVMIQNIPLGILSYVEIIIQASAVLLLTAAFFCRERIAWDYAKALILCALGFIAWKTSGEGWLFWVVIFIVTASGDTSLSRLAKLTIWIVSTITFLSAASVLLGITQDVTLVRDGETRYALGYLHPNTFGAALVTVAVAFSSLAVERKSIKAVLPCLILAIACNSIAASRTASLCIIFAALLSVIYCVANNGRKKRGILIATTGLVVFLAVFSIYLMVWCQPGSDVFIQLNSLLSGRVELSQKFYEIHHPSLFGYAYQDVEVEFWGLQVPFLVDNLYTHLLLRYGIVPTAILLLAILVHFYRAYAQRNLDLSHFGLTVFLVYGFAETLGCRIESNFYLVVLSQLLYAKGNQGFKGKTLRKTREDSAFKPKDR